ncbi:hypothetical protein Q7P37_008199 [Cladosporium fusiforme]
MSLLSRSSPTASSNPSRTPSPTASPASLHFMINDSERGAFDFFRVRMAGPLEIMSPAKGWIQQAMQMSLTSEAVFHGIVALGGANLAMASVSHATFTGLSKPEQHTEALQQYSKTVSALHNEIRDVLIGRGQLGSVLLTCLLLLCFELHAEQNSMAIRHHLLGSRIAKKYLSQGTGEHGSSFHGADSLQILVKAFDTLKVGSTLIESDSIADSATKAWSPQPDHLLQSPHTSPLSSAWSELDCIIDSAHQLRSRLHKIAEASVTAAYGDSIDQATRYCLSACASRATELPTDSIIIAEMRHLLDAHKRWMATYSQYFADSVSRPLRAFILLQIRHWKSYFALATCRDTRETYADRFECEFVHLIEIAEQYLKSTSATYGPAKPRSIYGNGQDDVFCLEDGVLSALHLVSIKSRTSTTRRRAVEVLDNANRREGLGSSTIISQFGKGIAGIEEDRARAIVQDLPEDLLSHQVPEAARFADVATAACDDIQRPACRLVCARYLHESDGEIEVVEYFGKGPCYPYSKCAGRCLTGFRFEKSKEAVRYALQVPRVGF